LGLQLIKNTKTNNFHESNVEIHNLNKEHEKIGQIKNSTELDKTLGFYSFKNFKNNETNKNFKTKHKTKRH